MIRGWLRGGAQGTKGKLLEGRDHPVRPCFIRVFPTNWGVFSGSPDKMTSLWPKQPCKLLLHLALRHTCFAVPLWLTATSNEPHPNALSRPEKGVWVRPPSANDASCARFILFHLHDRDYGPITEAAKPNFPSHAVKKSSEGKMMENKNQRIWKSRWTLGFHMV